MTYAIAGDCEVTIELFISLPRALPAIIVQKKRARNQKRDNLQGERGNIVRDLHGKKTVFLEKSLREKILRENAKRQTKRQRKKRRKKDYDHYI